MNPGFGTNPVQELVVRMSAIYTTFFLFSFVVQVYMRTRSLVTWLAANPRR